MSYRITLVAVLLIVGALPGAPRAEIQARAVETSASQIALLDSAATKRFFGLHYPSCSPPNSYYLGANEYQRYFRGWEFVLQRDRFDYEIVSDQDIINGALARYRLLILSNTAALTHAETGAIYDWVVGGGRLIATFGAGYKTTIFSPSQPDGMRLSDHIPLLWGDPFSTVFSTAAIDPNGVDIRIDQFEGPTTGLQDHLVNNVLHYGGFANLLMQPPKRTVRRIGSLIINSRVIPAQPAMLLGHPSQGLALYFAFAPEYLVSKEFGLPAPEQCPDGQNWIGRSYEGSLLMESSIRFMLQDTSAQSDISSASTTRR
jgi:hypothetical protein